MPKTSGSNSSMSSMRPPAWTRPGRSTDAVHWETHSRPAAQLAQNSATLAERGKRQAMPMMASASAGKVELVAVMVPSRTTGDAEVTIERDNVLVLRPGREEPSLVLVHPASGSASGFRRLAACYRVDRALYAFEALEPG